MFEPIAICVALATATDLPPPDYKVLSTADLAENCPQYIEKSLPEGLLCPVRGRKTFGLYSASRDLIIVRDGKSLRYTVAHELMHRVQHFTGVNGLSQEGERDAIRIGMKCR